MTRFSARHAGVAGLLIAIALVPVAYGRLSSPRDECPSNAALIDLKAIDPLTEIRVDGNRHTDVEAGFGIGTLEPRRADQVPMIFAIHRTFGLPNLLLAPASILPGRREPDDVRLETLETPQGEIPVHYAYERRGRVVRVTAYVMAYRGTAIRSPLWTRLANGPGALVSGRWPITLFAVSARTHARQMAPSLERVDVWLKDAWAHYQRVCQADRGSGDSTSDSAPL